MKIGAMIFATDQTIAIPRLAQEMEARGFESLWIPEKTHLPVSRRTPWPGGKLPEWYKRTSDPFLVLAAAASVTTKLRLGTGVAMIPLRDPIITAKEVATLDMLSAGRFEFGVGYGWNAEEFESHGVDIARAPDIMADKIGLMKALWTEEEGSFQSTHANVEPSWSWPKPVQSPYPSIHLGARYTKRAFRDIANYGNGWIPIEGFGDIVGHIPKLREAFAEVGRDPDSAIVSVYSSMGDPKMVEQYQAADIERIVLTLPAGPEQDVINALDDYARGLSLAP